MDLFKDLLYATIVKAAIQRLFLIAPFLSWGPLGVLVSHYLTKFAMLLYEIAETFIDLKTVPIKNEKLRKEFERASIKLNIIANGKGIDSPEFKEQRDADHKALLDLVTANRNK